MITGAHSVIYSKNPEADRLFFRDVLELPSVDVGGGWLISSSSEVAVHPSEKTDRTPLSDQWMSPLSPMEQRGRSRRFRTRVGIGDEGHAARWMHARVRTAASASEAGALDMNTTYPHTIDSVTASLDVQRPDQNDGGIIEVRKPGRSADACIFQDEGVRVVRAAWTSGAQP
jgi:hypothetical protein